MTPIELRSDNAAGVAPEILAAIVEADVGFDLAYGGDAWTERLQHRVREVFEHPDATIFPVTTGTAANALGLSALCPPWGSVLCHETAHILRSECGATSMFGGGATMHGLPGAASKLSPTSVHRAFDATNWGDPHHSQPSVISLTCPTDRGTVYSVPEVIELSETARQRGLRVHLDGARLANAVAHLGCRPADLTWRAGVDVVSLGATKNGAMSTDAIVSFDPAVSEQLVYRVKRAGHVASKMRFQSAQLLAYLHDDLWLRLAENANRAMAVLAEGLRALDAELLEEPQANIAFVRQPEQVADRMAAAGLMFYDLGGGVVRLVTSFNTTQDDAREAVARIAASMTHGA